MARRILSSSIIPISAESSLGIPRKRLRDAFFRKLVALLLAGLGSMIGLRRHRRHTV